MNFDFLKGLCGLDDIYEDCTNAEKLAVSMPVQSLFTSRRSAENLARFIYMTAHKEKMEGLSFMDILSDDTFRKFIRNREVMDAFHYIRKNGNRAVHGERQESSEQALDVLQDLHFVVGEAACILGLIKDYPQFDSDVKEYSDVVIVTEEDINKKAMEMFLEYTSRYDAEKEREKYYSPSDDEFHEYLIEGVVDMHEYLSFDHKPRLVAITDFILNYINKLSQLALDRHPDLADEIDLLDPVTVDIRIVINEEKEYDLDFADVLIFKEEKIKEELLNANSFTIDIHCSGNLREIYYDDIDEKWKHGMLRKDKLWDGSGMLDKLESFKRREKFSYYKIQYFPNSGNVTAAAIINGKSKDIQDILTDEILSLPNLELNCDGLKIYVDGEKPLSEYPELQNRVHKIVRNNVYEDQLTYCEEAWDPDDLNYEEDCIIPFVQIKGNTVAAYQAFLDELNNCLEPWKDEFEYFLLEPNFEDPTVNTSANILYNLDKLALATIEIIDGKLGLVGTVLRPFYTRISKKDVEEEVFIRQMEQQLDEMRSKLTENSSGS